MAAPITTTLSAACAVVDTSIKVASAASVAVGRFIVCDNEQMQVTKGYVAASTTVPVLRGLGGTVTKAHPSGASLSHGAAEDFSNPGPGNSPVNWPNITTTVVSSYTADGAITLPTSGTNAIAILNGTTQWDMTLAAPTNEITGSILYIVGNGKSAHTVTITAGIGNAGSGYTVMTFDTGGQCMVVFMACNGVWVPVPSTMSGTLTAIDVAVA